MLIKIKSQLTEIDGNVWAYIFPVSNDDVSELLESINDRRVICTLSDGYQWNCALMPDGNGDFFINVSKNVRKAANLELGDEVNFTLDADKSEYGMPVPEELVELWAMDEQAYSVFHKLTAGKQRSLLYRMGQPKTSATRAKRAVQFMEYLKSTNGILDYKELNIFVKNWNQ